jgi:uncharacterized protein YndB with AHSA1/START domain
MNTRDIIFDLELPIASESAYRLWTESKLLEKWLTTVANVDPKLNGPYELFWDPTNRHENSTLGCKVTSFVPSKILGFEWRGPIPYADLMNVQPFPTWVTIAFESIAIGNTIMHFRHSGWGEGDKWNKAKQWQTTAWQMAFKELEELVRNNKF